MAELAAAMGKIRGADRVERWAFALSGLAFGMLVLIGLIAAWTLQQIDASDYWVDHTYSVLDASQQLLVDVKDAELASRAFLLFPEDRFQTDFQNATRKIPSGFASLRTLTADNPNQQRRLDELGPLLNKRVENLAEIMLLRKDKGLDEVLSLRRDGARRVVAIRVRELCREIQDEEYRLLKQRIARRRTRLQQGLAGTLGAAALALVALLLAPYQVRRAILQRDLAHREKQESDSMVRSLFEAAPQAILIVDENGRIVMSNPATEKIFGFAPEEMRQLPLEALLPERLRDEHVGHRNRFFADPRTRPMGMELDLNARRKDASEIPVEVNLSFIHTARGVLAVAFASDISRRKTDELAIKEQREELRQLAGRLLTAREDESRRIARNLHDDLSQKLARISMDLGMLAAQNSFEEIAPKLRTLQSRIAETAELVRKISHEIHPAILDDLGLKTALDEFCLDFQQRSGIETSFDAHTLPDYLPSDVSSCVYYVAGECLRNVSKHSGAKSVSVAIEIFQGNLHMCIKDNGIGISPDRPKARGGIGVAAMKERIRLSGGTMSIVSGRGNGTQVECYLPIARPRVDSPSAPSSSPE